jgi:hypothetical protein
MTRVVNKYKEKYDVYCGRGSLLGNPFVIGKDGTREEVIEKFRVYFYDRIKNDECFRLAVLQLKGRTLGCFCKPQKCHCDIYVEYLERGENDE